MHQDNYAAKAPLEATHLWCSPLMTVMKKTDLHHLSWISHKLGDLPSEESKNFEFDDKGKIVKSYPIGNKVNIPEGYKAKQLKSIPKGV